MGIKVDHRLRGEKELVMYGQTQNSAASAAKWIFFGFFGIILMGFLLGANLKEATWLNPGIAAAEANRINIESAHQQATYALQERLAAAQTEVEIRKIQREQSLLDAQYQHEIQALEQDIIHSEIAFRMWMMLLTILAVALALILLIGTTIWMGSAALVYVHNKTGKEEVMSKTALTMTRRIPNLPERASYDPWQDPIYRRQKRVDAQQRERKNREDVTELAARMKAISNMTKMSSNEYHGLPLAGD